MEEEKQEDQELRWLDCIGSDLKSMDVKRRRKNAEDRSIWANILKEALVKLQGPQAGEQGGGGGEGRSVGHIQSLLMV
jgi:hypothetical protein